MQAENQEMNSGLLSLGDALNRKFELPELAAAEDTGAPKSESLTIVAHCFIVEEIGFLLPNNIVSEVVQDLPLCQLPHVPRWLWGMANLRGSILPMFDLRDLFGYGQSDPKRYRLLAINLGNEMVSIVIDNLPKREVFTVEEKLIGQPSLPDPLKMFARTCYKKNGRIWVDWSIDEFFSSLSRYW